LVERRLQPVFHFPLKRVSCRFRSFKTQMVESQTNCWLAHITSPPPLSPPASKDSWELSRETIRAQIWELLGQIPARPPIPESQTIGREDRGDYVVEKLVFDNKAGSSVPGYLLIPKGPAGKAPGILFCHWHGGEYDIGKEEMFQARHTPDAPGPALVRRGFVI